MTVVPGKALAVLAAAVAIVAVASAQPAEVLLIGKNAVILHRDARLSLPGGKLKLDKIGPEDLGHDGELVVRLSGIAPNPFKVRRSTKLENALAVIRGSDRYIVFDPVWLSGGFSRELVMAHEIGHHACGHTLAQLDDNPWARELEADKYAGAALRRLGADAAQVSAAAREMFTDTGSKSHPPRDKRIAAVEEGFSGGSNCVAKDIVKPYQPTAADNRAFERNLRTHCLQLVSEFCRSTHESTSHLLWLHGLMHDACGIPRAAQGSFGTAFLGIDCRGKGAFTEGKFKQ